MELFNSELGFMLLALVLILVGTAFKMFSIFLDKHGIENDFDEVGEQLETQGEGMIFVSEIDDSSVTLPAKEAKPKIETIKRKAGRPKKVL